MVINPDTMIEILDDAIGYCEERIGSLSGNGTIESQLWEGKKQTYEKMKEDLTSHTNK